MAIKIGEPVPILTDATMWLNSSFVDSDLLAGRKKCCLIYFWAKSCPTCKKYMPALQALRDRYASNGLQVIGVHMPRGPFDLDIEAVKTVIEELAITEPCAIDNDHAIGDQFAVKAWPTYFLFDRAGLLKRHAAGGFGVRMIEAALKDLYGE